MQTCSMCGARPYKQILDSWRLELASQLSLMQGRWPGLLAARASLMALSRRVAMARPRLHMVMVARIPHQGQAAAATRQRAPRRGSCVPTMDARGR
jgi:hypothetical protein